jgi:acyl transferase domain-containing protein
MRSSTLTWSDIAKTGASDCRGSAIAVVGLSCRLPGAANIVEFWSLLSEGRDAIDFPTAQRQRLGISRDGASRAAGYLPQVDGFDAGFFGVSPREARAMDPQQRLMLELAWEALEDAGIVPETLRETEVGVFVGATADDYAALTRRFGAVGHHTLTGTNRSIIANRVSHFLGVTGPSLAVDTGQSSSLVAVHLACASLRSGEA